VLTAATPTPEGDEEDASPRWVPGDAGEGETVAGRSSQRRRHHERTLEIAWAASDPAAGPLSGKTAVAEDRNGRPAAVPGGHVVASIRRASACEVLFQSDRPAGGGAQADGGVGPVAAAIRWM